jgi:hypothetical protein
MAAHVCHPHHGKRVLAVPPGFLNARGPINDDEGLVDCARTSGKRR